MTIPKNCESYSGNNPTTLLELIAKIEKQLGKKAQLNPSPFHQADMLTTWANIEKAERLLDWRPEVLLDEGISRRVK